MEDQNKPLTKNEIQGLLLYIFDVIHENSTSFYEPSEIKKFKELIVNMKRGNPPNVPLENYLAGLYIAYIEKYPELPVIEDYIRMNFDSTVNKLITNKKLKNEIIKRGV
jgi:hypothetical protein